MLRLFLLRHGQTAWNQDKRYQGQTDVPLDEIGRAQAARAAQRLAEEGLTRVYTSDLARAAETGRAIATAAGCELRELPGLREAHFGEWEGKTRAQIEAEYPGLFKRYLADSVNNRPEGGESLAEVEARVIAALQQIRAENDGGSVAVVGHGGSLRWILLQALGAPNETYRRLRLDNGGVSLVEFDGERSWLSLFNDVSHLKGMLSDVSVSIQLNQ